MTQKLELAEVDNRKLSDKVKAKSEEIKRQQKLILESMKNQDRDAKLLKEQNAKLSAQTIIKVTLEAKIAKIQQELEDAKNDAREQ